MANNIIVKDGNGVLVTVESTDTGGGIQRWKHDVATLPADPLGTLADAAIVTDITGSLSGKLRGLIKWAFERMPTSLGQKTMAASLPVVLASDQGSLPISIVGTGLVTEAKFIDLIGDATVSPRTTSLLSAIQDLVTQISLDTSDVHIGNTGETIDSQSQTLTVTASSPYSIGDCVGGLISYTTAARIAGGAGKIIGVLLSDKAIQNALYDILFFDANPTLSTFTDKNTAALSASDISKLIGSVSVLSYRDTAGQSFSKLDTNLPFKLASGQIVYAAVVIRGDGAVPTYATIGDIFTKIWISQS